MKTKIQTCLSILTIVVLFVFPATSSAAPPSPFVGHWKAIDLWDGSDIRLTIAGGGASLFHITWTESYFSFCEGKAGIVKGTGSLGPDDSNVLVADLQIKCFTIDKLYSYQELFRYNADTDTIMAEGSNAPQTWERAR